MDIVFDCVTLITAFAAGAIIMIGIDRFLVSRTDEEIRKRLDEVVAFHNSRL